ncbi:hypothetical protein A3E47_02695 [Candidatus Peribacteria bacterium RIFCSPHIGHO2_12_FULL_54_10]|nr:MAG: hypothetical protein A3E47_02695 [Candidatus Peribacteria bacterium RIFCSPHIGHO2_12_FULL_54_10]
MYDAAHMATPFFTLKGKTLVLIDWANVFHAQRKNGWNVDTRRLFTLFKDHQEVQDIVLFHGTDQHEKSASFLTAQAAVGYRIVTKAVKKVPVTVDHEGKPLLKPILRRKCDFDVEIAKEILLSLGYVPRLHPRERRRRLCSDLRCAPRAPQTSHLGLSQRRTWAGVHRG